MMEKSLSADKQAQLDDLIDQKNKFYARIKELTERKDACADAKERLNYQNRIKVLTQMYRDVCDQIESLRPPQEKKHKSNTKVVSSDQYSFDFFERCGTVWSDIEGVSWSVLSSAMREGTANQSSFLMKALQGALSSLTEKQLEYIMMYYASKTTLREVGEIKGVDFTTVCRTIKRGLKNIERYIIASLRVYDCINPDGFDFMKFANNTDVLTEREREYLYMMLSKDVSLKEISEFVERSHSTISRTINTIEKKLHNVNSGIDAQPPSDKINKSDWITLTEKEVAENLGISKRVYYANICRDQNFDGLSRLSYEILSREGRTAQDVASEIGIAPATVRKYRKKYAGVEVSNIDPPEPYNPKEKKVEGKGLQRLLSEARGSTIGDHIDGDMYRRMMEVAHANS